MNYKELFEKRKKEWEKEIELAKSAGLVVKQRTEQEVENLIQKLIDRYGKDVVNVDWWRILFSAPWYVCPRCGREISYLRKMDGKVVGCDYCLKIAGYTF